MSKPARIVFVSAHFGDGENEVGGAIRLVAGALAHHGEVTIVLLRPSSEHAVTRRRDSIFEVVTVPVHRARPLRSDIVRAAFRATGQEASSSGRVATALEVDGGDAPKLASVLEELAPDALVLVGDRFPFAGSLLEKLISLRPCQLVLVPFATRPDELATTPLRALLELADLIMAVHPGEHEALARSHGDKVVPLDLALPLNRGATANSLFGVRHFGQYVVLIRNFPPSGPRRARSVTHEVLGHVLGGISVAEVDGEAWRITDGENTLELPVNPSRINLWRLMAHAIATIDVRPQGPFGREALESMLLGTPVVVPDDSPARTHVQAGNGGLWYSDIGEMFTMARALLHRDLRDRLGAQGKAYTLAHHCDMDGFVDRIGPLVLGH